MSDTPDPPGPPGRGPGADDGGHGWGRIYARVAIAAVIVMLLLWWLTEAFNIPLPRR